MTSPNGRKRSARTLTLCSPGCSSTGPNGAVPTVLLSIDTTASTAGLVQVVHAQDKKILKVRAYADLRSFDPAHSQGITDEEIHSSIYSKLIQYKPGREWEWELDAAESIEQVDPTHIKFKLKPGIMFTNGYGEMTAEDVKYSFERILDESLESTNTPDWGSLKEVVVEGKYEGTIVFSEPYPPAWSIALPYIVGNIVSKKAWEEAGGKVETTTPTASGPYSLKEWQPKQKTILERNPDWHGGEAAFDEIHIFPIDDENTAQIAFEAGDIDYTRVSLSSVGTLRDSPPEGATLDEYPSLYYVWVGMNVENDVTSDENLRKAIQLDKNAWPRQRNKQKQTNCGLYSRYCCPLWTSDYDTLEMVGFDVVKHRVTRCLELRSWDDVYFVKEPKIKSVAVTDGDETNHWPRQVLFVPPHQQKFEPEFFSFSSFGLATEGA